MNMDRIKRIVQIGAVEAGNWNTNGDVLVFFEDESKAPVRVPAEDGYQVYEEYARQNGLTGEIDEIISQMSEDTLGIADKNNQEELDAVMAEFEEAKRKAEEAQRGHGGPGVIIPGPGPGPQPGPTGGTGNGTSDNGNEDEEEIEDEDDYSDSLESPVAAKKDTGKRVIAGLLAGAAALGAGYTAYQLINQNQAENTRDVDDDQDLEDTQSSDQSIDFDSATFEEIMDAMDDNDARKVVSQDAMELVETFHEETHKDGNFRLVEDGQTYLDLSFE